MATIKKFTKGEVVLVQLPNWDKPLKATITRLIESKSTGRRVYLSMAEGTAAGSELGSFYPHEVIGFMELANPEIVEELEEMLV